MLHAMFFFFFDSHIFSKKKKISDCYLSPHESASPASSLILHLRETGRLSNCNYVLAHSATFCNHPSNSPALGCCKLRLREFVQQITLSHPCNRKAEFRAQEKPQLPLCGLVAGFLGTGKGSLWLGGTWPWERHYP